MKPIQVVCAACDSLLGTVIVHGVTATWQPHQPMRRDQRADFFVAFPEGLPTVSLEDADDPAVSPQAYCPNGHEGFDSSKESLRAAVGRGETELRLRPDALEE